MAETARPAGEGDGPAVDSGGTDLAARIRALTTADPTGVRQVVTDVLAALDRVGGGWRGRWVDPVADVAETEAVRPDAEPLPAPETPRRPAGGEGRSP